MDDEIPEEFDPDSNGCDEVFGMKMEVEDVVPMDETEEVSTQPEPYECNTCIVCLDLFYSHTDSQIPENIFRTFSNKLGIDGIKVKRLWDFTNERPLCQKCFNFAGRIHELEAQLVIIMTEMNRRLDWVKKAMLASEKQRQAKKSLPGNSYEIWRGVILRPEPKKIQDPPKKMKGGQNKRKKDSISITLDDRQRPGRSNSVSVQDQNENDTITADIQEELDVSCSSDSSYFPVENQVILIQTKRGRGRPRGKTVGRLKEGARISVPVGSRRSLRRPRKFTVQNEDDTPVDTSIDDIKEELQEPDSPDRSCSPEIDPFTSIGDETSADNEDFKEEQDSEAFVLQNMPLPKKTKPRVHQRKQILRIKKTKPTFIKSDDGEEWLLEETPRGIKRKSGQEYKNPWIFEENKITCCSIEVTQLGDHSLQCTKCNVTIEAKSLTQAKFQMHRHMKIVHLRTFTCSVCSKVFATEIHLERHQATHRVQTETKCDICGKPLTRFALNGHLWTHKNSEEQEEQRANGGFVPMSARHLNIRYPCRMCNRSFKLFTSLKTHKLTHLSKEEKQERLVHMCNICGKRYSEPGKLKRHMETHLEGGLDKPIDKSDWFPCFQCEKRYRSRGALKYHQVSHSTDYACCCEICGKGFRRESALQRHITHVHECVRPHQCNLCDKAFKCKPALVGHCKRFHPDGKCLPQRPQDVLKGMGNTTRSRRKKKVGSTSSALEGPTV